MAKKGKIKNKYSKKTILAYAITAAVAGLGFGHGRSASAAVLYWDPGTPGQTGVMGSGGSGNWDYSTTEWADGTDPSGSDVAWSDATAPNTAIFAGTSGTVNITGNLGNGNVNVNTIDFNVTGYTLSGGTITLGGTTPTIAVGGSNATISSTIAGSAGINVTGSTGTLTLGSSNSYTGGTTISGGTLSISSDSNLGSAGGVTINGGTLQVTGSGITTSRVVTLGSSGGTIDVTGASFLDLTTAVTGSGGLTLNGDNGNIDDLELDAAANYNGATAINSGQLFEQTTNALPTGTALSIGGPGTLSLGGFSQTVASLNGSGLVQSGPSATLTVNGGGTYSGLLNGAGLALAVGGGGTLVLSGGSNYGGGTTISGGELSISADNNLGSVTGGVTINGGTLQVTGSGFATSRLFTLGSSGGTIDVTGSSFLELTTAMTGSGGLTVNGDSGANYLQLQAAANYGGGTTINSGQLFEGTAGALPSGTALSIAGPGTLVLGTNSSQTVASLNGSGEIYSSGTPTLTVNGGGTFSGSITGSPSLAVAGGTLVLSGSNSYSGSTSIYGTGTLTVGSNNAIPSGSAVSVGNGATNGTLNLGTFTNTAASLVFGSAGDTLNITLGGSLTTTSSTNLNNGTINVSGTTSPSVGEYTLIAANSLSGSLNSSTSPSVTFHVESVGNNVELVQEAAVTMVADAAYNNNVRTGAQTIGVNIANTAPVGSDAAVYSLGAPVGNTLNGVSGSRSANGGTPVDQTGTYTASAGVNTNTISITNTGINAWTNSPPNVTITQTAYDFANANYAGGVLNFGNVRTNAGVPASQTVSFTNQTVTSAAYQDNLGAVLPTTSNGNVTATGFTGLAAGAPATNLTVSVGSTANAGSLNSTVTLNLVSQALGGTGLSNGVPTIVVGGAVTTTGGIYDYAQAQYTGGNISFGFVHSGGGANQTVAFGNPLIGSNPTYQDTLDVTNTFTNNANVTATGFSGLVASAGGATTANLTLSASGAGSLNSTVSFTLVSDGSASGLANGVPTVIGGGVITTTGTIYTGTSVWNTNGSGTWGTLANNFGVNWGSGQGSPGLDPGHTTSDTATFDNMHGITNGSSATVTLDGANPSLLSITFNTGTGGYTLATGTGGSLTLATTGGQAAINVTGTQTISAAIAGTNGIAISNFAGAGKLDLSGNNTYTGGTTVSSGILQAGSATAFGASSSAVSVTAGAVLDLNGTTLTNTNGLTLNGTGIASGGALINSSGTAATYAGLVALGSASSIVASGGNITLSNAGTITGAGDNLTLGGANNGTIASIIGTTSGNVTMAGTGSWTLNGADTFTGGLVSNSGTVVVGNATALGTATTATFPASSTGKVNLNGNNITLVGLSTSSPLGTPVVQDGAAGNSTLTLNFATPTNNTFGGVLQNGSTGILALTSSGTGTLTLSGNNTYTGPTAISGGTTNLTGSLTGTNITTTNAATAFTESTTGVIGGTGSTFTVTNGTVTLAGSNTYTGGTTLTAGILNINQAGGGVTNSAIGTGALVINGGTIDNTSGASLTLATNNAVTMNAGFTFGAAAETSTHNLNFGNTSSINVVGPQTISLAGASTTLAFGGMTLSTNENVTVNGPGNTLQLGTFAISPAGNCTLQGTGNINITGVVSDTANTQLNYNGSGTLSLGGANTFTGNFIPNSTAGAGAIIVNNPQAFGPAATATVAFGGGAADTISLNGNNVTLLALTEGTVTTTAIVENSNTGTVSNATLTLNAAAGQTFDGVFKDGTGTGGTLSVNLLNIGGVTLGGASSYTGTLTVADGSLTVASTGTFSSSSSLVLGGGVLQTTTIKPTITFSSGRTGTQNFASTTFDPGYEEIYPANTTATTIGLGTLTRSSSDGSVVIIGGGNAGTTLNANVTLTSTTGNSNFTNGQQTIIGGYMILPNGATGADWVQATGAGPTFTLSALPAGNYTAAFTAGKDVALGGNQTYTGAGATNTINSFKWTGPSANTLTLNAALTIATGGFLVTGAGANASTINGTGSITSGNGQDLIFIFQNNNTSTLTLSAPIVGNIGLTAEVPQGTVIMNLNFAGSATTLSGDVNILGNNGNKVELNLQNATALQNATLNWNNLGGVGALTGASGAASVFSPGTFTAVTLGGLKGSQNFALENSNAAAVAYSIGNNNVNNTFSGVLSFAGGSIIKVGTGIWTLTGTNTYTGTTTVSGGELILTASNAYAGATTIGNGGTLALTGAGSINNSASITIAGGARFDVSGVTSGPYALSQPLTATSTGTATLNGSLNAGSQTINMQDGTNTGVLAFNNNLSLNSATLKVDLGATNNVNDEITVGGTLTAAGTDTINVAALTGQGTLAATYTLINDTGANIVGGGNFVLSSPSILIGTHNYSLSLASSTSSAEILTTTLLTNPTWYGATSSAWNVGTNWSTGTPAGSPTGSTTDATVVVFDGSDTTTSGSNAHSFSVTVDPGRNIGTIIFTNNPAPTTASAYTIGGGSLALTNGGSIQITNTTTTANVETINAPLVLEGTNGAYAFTNNSTQAGQTLNFGGAISEGAASGTTSLTLNGTYTGTGANANVISGPISNGGGGTLALVVASTGQWNLSASNSYTGGTTINSGILNINGDAALGTAPGTAAINITFGGNSTLQAGATAISLNATRNISISTGATATIDTVSAANTVTIPGVISGGGGISLINAGTLVLSGANTFTGGVTVAASAGKLDIDNATALGTAASTFTLNGGTIDNNTAGAITMTANNPITLGTNPTFVGTQSLNLGTGAVSLGASRIFTVNANTLTVGGIISGTGFSITKAGSGALALGGANTFTGGVTLNLGTLDIDSATALGTAAGTFVLNAGTIDNNSAGAVTMTANNPITLGTNLAFTGTQSLNLGTGAVALGASRTMTLGANTLTLGGAISGAGDNITDNGAGNLVLNGVIGTTTGAVNMTGTGTLSLGGVNTFTGGVNLTSGTLELNNGAALGATGSTLIISNGTTIDNNANGGNAITNVNPEIWNGNFTFAAVVGNGLGLGTGAVTLGTSTGSSITITTNLQGTDGLTVNGVISNGTANSLIKAGGGILVLGGQSLYNGGTTIEAGSLFLSVGNTGSTSGPVGPSADAVTLGFNGAGGNANASLLTNANNIAISNPINVASVTSGVLTIGGNSGNPSTFQGAVTLANAVTLSQVTGGSVNFTTGITGTGNVTITSAGTGTVILSASNNYNGTTSINSGRLVLAQGGSLNNTAITVTSPGVFSPRPTTGNSVSAGGSLTLNSGATFDMSGDGNAGTFNLAGSLTGTANTYGFDLGLNGASTVTDQLISASGAASLSGSNTISITTFGSGVLTASSYPLITATAGGLLGDTFTLSNASLLTYGGNVYKLGLSNSNTAESLTISQVSVLTWTGAAGSPGNWDINTTQNWASGAAASTYQDGSIVSFNDKSAISPFGTITQTQVTLAATVTPSAVTFNDAVVNYTVGGFGIAGSGTPLTKNFAGTVTLNNSAANTYTGATTVNGGTLLLDFSNLAAPTNLISGSSALVLAGGTFSVKGNASSATSQTVSGLTVNPGASAVTVTANGQNTVLNMGTMTRPSVGGTVNFTDPTGTQSATNGITTNNTNTNNVIAGWATVNGTDWASNSTNLAGGNIIALLPGNYTANGNGATVNVDITGTNQGIGAGATAYTWRYNTAVSENNGVGTGTLTIGSGGMLETANVGNNPVNLTGNNITSGSADLIVIQNNTSNTMSFSSTAVVGAIGLTKSGAGTLILGATDTYSGTTTINAGTLDIATVAQVQNSPLITIAPGATFLNTGGLTLTATQTIQGSGTVSGALTTVSGTNLSPGFSNIGTLTTGSLTLATGTKLNYYLGTPGTNLPSLAPGTSGLIAASTVTLPAGSVVVNLTDNANANSLGSMGGGVYELISYTSLAGTAFSGSSFSIGTSSLTGRQYQFTSTGTGAGQIDLIVAGQALTWTNSVANPNAWDTTSTNWSNGTGAGSATMFSSFAQVTFQDTNTVTSTTLSTPQTVSVQSAGVEPFSVTFTNNAVNYIINNAGTNGILGTGSLTVSGTGSVTLNGSNSYTGGTVVSNGKLIADNAAALGGATSPLQLNGGTLDLNLGTGTNFGYNTTIGGTPVTIVSDTAGGTTGVTHTLGTLSIGADTLNLNAGATQTTGTAGLTFGTATLTGNAVFNTAASTNLTLGALGGQFTVTKQGSGTLTLNTAANANRNAAGSAVTLTLGTIVVGNATALGTNAVPLQLNGGTLDLNVNTGTNFGYATTVGGTPVTIVSDTAGGTTGLTHTLGTLSIAGDQLNLTAGGSVTIGTAGLTFGATTLTASTAVFDTAANTLLTLGAIGGNFAFTKQDSGTMTLASASTRNNATGITNMSGGRLNLDIATALDTTAATGPLNLSGGTTAFEVAAGATYDVGLTTVSGTSTIESNHLGGGAGVTQTLTTLSIGANQLNITGGAGVTSGTAGVTFGSVTLTGAPTFNITNPAGGGVTQLSLGAVTNSTFTATITGSGNLAQTGVWGIGAGSGGITIGTGVNTGFTGTVTLNQTNGFTGSLTLNSGTLEVDNAQALGAGAATFVTNGGTIDNSNNGITVTANNAQTWNGSFAYLGTFGLNMGAGAVSLAAPITITTTANQLVEPGAITGGANSITKLGAGILALSGNNNFSGGVAIKNGTLSSTTTNANNFGSGTITLGDVANTGLAVALRIDGTGDTTYANPINVVGTGAATIMVTNWDETFSGSLTLNNTNVTLATGVLSNNDAPAFSGGITGAGNVTVSINGTNIANATTHFTFSTNPINNTGSLTFNNAAVTAGGITGAATTWNETTANSISTTIGAHVTTLTLGSVNANLITLSLSGANTAFAGPTIINSGGVLQLGNVNALADSTLNNSGAAVASSVTFTVGGNNTYNLGGLTGSGALSIGANTLSVGGNNSTTIYSGAIANTAGNFTKVGNGSLTLAGGNLYTGATSDTSGTLIITGTLGNSAVTVGAATLQLNGASAISQNLLTVNNAAGVVTENTANALSGTAALSESAGLVTLSQSNNFSGATTLSGGTLALGNNSALGTSAVTFSGGTLLSTTNGVAITNSISDTGTATIGGSNTLQLGGTFTNSGGNRTLTISNSALTTISGNVYLSEAAGTGRTLNVNGTGNLTVSGPIADFNGAGTPGSLTLAAGYTGTVTLNAVNTYTGATLISAGTLMVGDLSHPGALASIQGTGLTINGATAVLRGHGNINAPVNFLQGTIFPGGSIGTMNMASLTMSNGDNYDYDFVTPAPYQNHVAGSTNDSINITQNAANTLVFPGVGTVTLMLDPSSSDQLNSGSGSYKIFSYTNAGAVKNFTGGTITGNGTDGSIVLSGFNSNTIFTIVNDPTDDGIFLDFTNGNFSITSATPTFNLLKNAGGGTVSQSVTVMNNASANPDTATFTLTPGAPITATNPVGTINPGSSANGSLTLITSAYIAPGSQLLTVTPSTGPSNTSAINYNVGEATAAWTDRDNGINAETGIRLSHEITGSDNPLSNALFNPTNALTAQVSHNGTYGGLDSVAHNVQPGGTIFQSEATILQGTDTNITTNTVTMNWRTAATIETTNPTNPPITSGNLISDVVRLSGLSDGTGNVKANTSAVIDGNPYNAPIDETDTFVLQMKPSILLSSDVNAATPLVWLDPISTDPNPNDWVLANVGDFNSAPQVIHLATGGALNYDGSFSNFQNIYEGGDLNLNDYLGAFGYDPAGGDVWAVINHDGQFAVVPEPTSLGLLGIGAIGLLARKRKNRA